MYSYPDFNALGQGGFVQCITDEYLYIVGGHSYLNGKRSDQINRWSFKDKKWEILISNVTSLIFTRVNYCFITNNELHILCPNSIGVLNLRNFDIKWTPLVKQLNVGFSFHICTAHEDCLSKIISGGQNGNAQILDDFVINDARNNIIFDKMNIARYQHMSTQIIDGSEHIPIVFGGLNSNNEILHNVEYRFAQDRWKYLEPMNYGRYSSGIVNLPDQHVMIAGGIVDINGINKWSKRCEIYSLKKDSWKDTRPIPFIPESPTCYHFNKYVVVQGLNGCAYYDWEKDSWDIQEPADFANQFESKTIEYGISCIKCNRYYPYAEKSVDFKCWSCRNGF